LRSAFCESSRQGQVASGAVDKRNADEDDHVLCIDGEGYRKSHNTAVSKLGTQAHEDSFARGRRLAHNDQREETLIRTLGEVIRYNVCRANVGILANIDASTHCDRHAGTHWPPGDSHITPIVGTVLERLVAGLTLMGIYLPDPAVQELSGLLGFDLSMSIRRWISTGESQFPCYLEELIDFQGLTGEWNASTSQCRILNTSGFSNQRRYKAAQLARGPALGPKTHGNVSDDESQSMS
jgi:hypothetical protein